MEIGELAFTVILAIVGGGAGAAVVAGLFELLKFRASRKAVKEDRAEEREDRTSKLTKTVNDFKEDEKQKNKMIDQRLENIEKRLDALTEAQKVILLDRILYLGQSYIDKKVISYDDRKRFHDMHDSYHNGLGGNGDADLVVAGVDALPLSR